MKPNPPRLSDSDLTPAYVRALLTGKADCHIDTLQNAAHGNTIRHDGRLIVEMDGNAFDVSPSEHNAQHLTLDPLTITMNGQAGYPVAGLDTRAARLSWGWAAFQAAILDGSIRIDRTFRAGGFLLGSTPY